MSAFSIVWFRQDLRLHDNPGLTHAVQKGAVLPVYILDDDNSGPWAMGAASRVWLHQALQDLNGQLDGQLRVYKGDPQVILAELMDQYPVQGLYWGRCYEPWRRARDEKIKKAFGTQDREVKSFNHSLLWEPWEIQKKDGTPYKVFTPFYRKGCLNGAPPRQPLAKPDGMTYAKDVAQTKLSDLGLIPDGVDWYSDLCRHWDISEDGAQAQLDWFVEEGLQGYKTGRDFPAQPHISRLSPYLHFGQISPHQAWYAARHIGGGQGWERDTDCFCSELAWREFSHSLLYYNRDLPDVALQPKFNSFAWREDSTNLRVWQKGLTGYPIIDAGMRELWQTGYMHNRVRMIVASFLVKNLMITWQEGERWFWDCLFDADLANNGASWQWVAGCGADAAPYFRIFNPVTQSEKFDPDGDYICTYVPELAQLPKKYIHKPWSAPVDVLRVANVQLDETYPRPMVDLKVTRERALAAFKDLKS